MTQTIPTTAASTNNVPKNNFMIDTRWLIA